MARDMENEGNKNLNDKEYKDYKEIIELGEIHADKLSQWEQEFLASMDKNFATYEQRTILSEKQRNIFERISKKIYAT